MSLACGRSHILLCFCALVASPAIGMASASLAAAPERGVHRFLAVAISPDGRNVASVEGDASPSGGEPVIRMLMIRTADGRHSANVALPCGQSRQCWPSSPAWSADGKTLAFALRQPGSHARTVYTVTSDGNKLTEILR